MKLEYYKDYICAKDAPKPCLTIAKKALEKARDHYTAMIVRSIEQGDDYGKVLYTGKRNLINEFLGLFDMD